VLSRDSSMNGGVSAQGGKGEKTSIRRHRTNRGKERRRNLGVVHRFLYRRIDGKGRIKKVRGREGKMKARAHCESRGRNKEA